jgi:hypothetical protein
MSNQELQQYMFHESCLTALADLVDGYQNPCCLCTPTLGRKLAQRGRVVRVPDVDDRFADLPGFRRFDVHAPENIDEAFDVIISDVPFLDFPLARMFDLIAKLSQGNFNQKLLMTYASQAGWKLVDSFQPFGIVATGYYPPYALEPDQKFVEFFGNLGEEQHAILRNFTRSQELAGMTNL